MDTLWTANRMSIKIYAIMHDKIQHQLDLFGFCFYFERCYNLLVLLLLALVSLTLLSCWLRSSSIFNSSFGSLSFYLISVWNMNCFLCFYIDLQEFINSHQSRFNALILHTARTLAPAETAIFCVRFGQHSLRLNAIFWFEYFNMFHCAKNWLLIINHVTVYHPRNALLQMNKNEWQ